MELRHLAASAAFVVLSLGSGTAGATDDGRALGVVELFTSQGCHSCPRADAVLAELAAEGNVIALGFHVDYWDYLGWSDTFAEADNTQRQKDYAQALEARSVYTPQAVLNGRVHLNGGKERRVREGLAALDDHGSGMLVDVSIERVGDTLVITAGDGPAGKAHIVVVGFDTTATVPIGHGENGGQTITYANPVRHIQAAGLWHGAATRYELPASEIEKRASGGCAVLLQTVLENGMPGPILGADMLSFANSGS